MFQRHVQEVLESSQDISTPFLNSLLNQLNWAFSEFIGMLQEVCFKVVPTLGDKKKKSFLFLSFNNCSAPFTHHRSRTPQTDLSGFSSTLGSCASVPLALIWLWHCCGCWRWWSALHLAFSQIFHDPMLSSSCHASVRWGKSRGANSKRWKVFLLGNY